MIVRVLVLFVALLLASCGGRVVLCDEVTPAAEGAPVAAVGPRAPFAPEAVAIVVGPFPDGAIVDEVELGGAPGWGCSAPAGILVAAWSSKDARPAGDPLARAAMAPVIETTDLGEGFTARRVALPETVYVGRGGSLVVSMTLDKADACGAKTTGKAGRSWRWRGGAWEPLDGELVARVGGCVEREP